LKDLRDIVMMQCARQVDEKYTVSYRNHLKIRKAFMKTDIRR
jgi:hypothetical protein